MKEIEWQLRKKHLKNKQNSSGSEDPDARGHQVTRYVTSMDGKHDTYAVCVSITLNPDHNTNTEADLLPHDSMDANGTDCVSQNAL